MVVEVACMDQRQLNNQRVSLVIMTLITQQLIKPVPVNMPLMFALNHTSVCLFKPAETETTPSSSCRFEQVQLLGILPLLFLDLHHPFSCLLPGSCAQQQSRIWKRSCSHSSGPFYGRWELRTLPHRTWLPIAFSLCACISPIYSCKLNKIKAV